MCHSVELELARAAHDCEVDAFVLFFRMLYLVRMRREGEDKLWWILSKKRVVWC
jgi:hypothetical protein